MTLRVSNGNKDLIYTNKLHKKLMNNAECQSVNCRRESIKQASLRISIMCTAPFRGNCSAHIYCWKGRPIGLVWSHPQNGNLTQGPHSFPQLHSPAPSLANQFLYFENLVLKHIKILLNLKDYYKKRGGRNVWWAVFKLKLGWSGRNDESTEVEWGYTE